MAAMLKYIERTVNPFVLGAFLGLLGVCATVGTLYAMQDTLSPQVLRLLDRVNSWSVVQTFAVDPIFSEVHTAAPASTLCDVAGELGKQYWDSTNDVLYWCSGASGWRKFTSAAP